MAIEQVLQVVGAILILAGFIGAQLECVRQNSPSYLWVNLIGSALLAVLAWLGSQWGFLLLESVWAAASLIGLIGLRRSRRKRAHSPPTPTDPG